MAALPDSVGTLHANCCVHKCYRSESECEILNLLPLAILTVHEPQLNFSDYQCLSSVIGH